MNALTGLACLVLFLAALVAALLRRPRLGCGLLVLAMLAGVATAL